MFGIVVVVGSASAVPGRGDLSLSDLATLGIVALSGVISWAVTRWRVDGDTLRVESGLIRRQSLQVPLSRTQAVDLVEPFIARVLGLAEVRVRTGGASRGDARLCYLRHDDAVAVRAALLAVAHGLHEAVPEPAELLLAQVPNGRLLVASCLTGWIPVSLAAAVGLVVLATSARGVLLAGGSGLIGLFIALSLVAWRRISAEWSFTVAEAPDGLRVRSGLLALTAETVPRGRIQAVRMLEPLWFRPLGWCRLDLHLAGGVKGGGGHESRALRRTLLPVGPRSSAFALLDRMVPDRAVEPSRPPRRAMVRAPFSYHFLSAGVGRSCAMATYGRIRKETVWIPLGKAQSIRAVQGPVQSRLRLATVRLDVAGRLTRATLRDRSATEARTMLTQLPMLCALARSEQAAVPAPDGPRPGEGAQVESAGPLSPPAAAGQVPDPLPEERRAPPGPRRRASLGLDTAGPEGGTEPPTAT